MDETLISLFIDDEMNLDEKITFVEMVGADRSFACETVSLLEQEKLLSALPTEMPREIMAVIPKQSFISRITSLPVWRGPLVGLAVAMLVGGLAFLLKPNSPIPSPTEHRFVLYLPEADHTRIVGTFTGWQAVPMEKIGDSGYWTLTLKLPQGEHRYSYLVEGGKRIVDPTVPVREHDDFGGENSLLIVGGGDVPLS